MDEVMLNRARISSILNSKGYPVRRFVDVAKTNSKVCRVQLRDGQSAIVKLWPYYPLRFTGFRLTRKWVDDHVSRCSLPYNEFNINKHIAASTGLKTPDIYLFERIFPMKSLRYGHLMLQEDLAQTGYKDLDIVLRQLIESHNRRVLFDVMEQFASIVAQLFDLGVFNEDKEIIRNYLVNERYDFALIDFERYFLCEDAQKMANHKDLVLQHCVANYNKLTRAEVDFSPGLEPLLRLMR